jgi:hypothetical protein
MRKKMTDWEGAFFKRENMEFYLCLENVCPKEAARAARISDTSAKRLLLLWKKNNLLKVIHHVGRMVDGRRVKHYEYVYTIKGLEAYVVIEEAMKGLGEVRG